MIAKCTNPPKDNEKQRKQVRFNEKGNRACDNGKNNGDQNIYVSMARMSSNDEHSSENYGERFTIDQLDFRFRINVPHDTRSFGFHSRIIIRYG